MDWCGGFLVHAAVVCVLDHAKSIFRGKAAAEEQGELVELLKSRTTNEARIQNKQNLVRKPSPAEH